MYKILEKSALKIHQVKLETKRYLHARLDIRDRFIGIKGARGTGKTTLLLQLAKEHNNLPNALYVSCADVYFTENSLHELAKRLAKQGGRLLLLDDVHLLPHWSDELKRIYTDCADLQVIFTYTALLDVHTLQTDMSRRIAQYHLKEMSFREFVLFKHGVKWPVVKWPDLLANHESVATDLLKAHDPLPYLTEYVKFGAYPHYTGDAFAHNERLLQNVHLTLEVDMPAVENTDFLNVTRFKRMLRHVAAKAPYAPTIQPLSQEMDLTRNATVRTLQLLDKAALVLALYSRSRGVTVLNKPDKLWPANTNLLTALANENTLASTKWETFVLQHLAHDHELALTDADELLIDGRYTLAFSGKEKGLEGTGTYIFKDDIRKGSGHVLPLWMVGLVY